MGHLIRVIAVLVLCGGVGLGAQVGGQLPAKPPAVPTAPVGVKPTPVPPAAPTPSGPPPMSPGPIPRGVPFPAPDMSTQPPATPRGEAPPGMTRVPADYAARAMLAIDPVFVGRVTTAVMVVADDVATEGGAAAPARRLTGAPLTGAPATPEEIRLALVGGVLRDPEYAGRRWARLVAANIPVTMGIGGAFPATPATDDELVAFIAARWSAIATAMGAF